MVFPESIMKANNVWAAVTLETNSLDIGMPQIRIKEVNKTTRMRDHHLLS